MSQLSYSRNMAKAIAGTLYDLSPRVIDSYAVESGTIYPGFGVVAGTDVEAQVVPPSVTVSAIKGIVLLQSKEQNDDGTVTFVADDTVPVLDKGRAWVPVIGAVTADAQAYLVFTGANLGKWAAGAGEPVVASAITGAKFKTSTSGAGLAVVELK